MGSKGLSTEHYDEAYVGARVDKQDVVFETGLFSIFHGHEKQLCFHLCVCVALFIKAMIYRPSVSSPVLRGADAGTELGV